MENHHAKRRQPPRSRSANGRSTSKVRPSSAAALLDAVSSVAEDQLEAASEMVGDYVELGRSKVDELGNRLQAQISHRPWQVLLTAIGIGMLAGLLIRRK